MKFYLKVLKEIVVLLAAAVATTTLILTLPAAVLGLVCIWGSIKTILIASCVIVVALATPAAILSDKAALIKGKSAAEMSRWCLLIDISATLYVAAFVAIPFLGWFYTIGMLAWSLQKKLTQFMDQRPRLCRSQA